MPSAPARSLASDELFVMGGARQRTGHRRPARRRQRADAGMVPASSRTDRCGSARCGTDLSDRSNPLATCRVPRPCGRRRRTPLLAPACPVTGKAERQPYRLKFGVRDLMALGAMIPRRIEPSCAWDRGPGSSVGTRSGCWRTGGGVERHQRDVNRLRLSECRVKLNHLDARAGSPVHFTGATRVCRIRPVGSPQCLRTDQSRAY